jgi:hypothetical protein
MRGNSYSFFSHFGPSILSRIMVFFFIVVVSLFAGNGYARLHGGVVGSPNIHETVHGVVIDGVRQDVPSELQNKELASIGLVDVTAAPFLADPSGKKDSTKAIQAAINFARDQQMVCFFPSGVYAISDTITCLQNPYLRSNGKMSYGKNFPCVLMGSRKGNRPKILLRANSPGFSDEKRPKYVIHFWARNIDNPSKPQPNCSFDQMLLNLDVVIGEGNSGAVAVRHSAAQGSTIQDCTIDATFGLTGIEGAPGSGGSIAGVTVIGGRFGLDIREAQPAPTVTGVTLIGQRETALLYSGPQALSAVGIKIVSKAKGPVVKLLSVPWNPHFGQMSLQDSEIVFEEPGDTAIFAERSVYLKNVYIKHAATAVSASDGAHLNARADGWLLIREYAHEVASKAWKGYQYTMPIYINGIRHASDIEDVVVGSEPREDLVMKHTWSMDFPNFETKGSTNVKSHPFNAKGDGIADDTNALQSAIDSSEIVFLPKGYYAISKPLRLKPTTKLVGISGHLSVIIPLSQARLYAHNKTPLPLVESSDSPSAETVLAFIGLHAPPDSPRAYALHWRSGPKSFVRCVNFISAPPRSGFGYRGKIEQKNFPFVLISGSGGGKWYNFYQESHLHQGSEYRHLLVSDTSASLSFYQLNAEHSRGEANVEIRRSRNVSIYGFKGEGNSLVLWVRDSDNISLLGYGGNGAGLPGESLFLVENTPNFLFVNLLDHPRLSGKGVANHFAGIGVDPDKWTMVKEQSVANTSYASQVLERPLVYKRSSNGE